VNLWLIYLQGWSQRLDGPPLKSDLGLNRMEPRGRHAGGWCARPMDGHGGCADALDDGMTARTTSCHACPWRRPLSVRAMMARRVQAPRMFPTQVLMRPIDSSCPLLPGLAWPRRGGSRALSGAVRAMPWLGGSASEPLVSSQETLLGGGQGQVLAPFVMFFASCLLVQTHLCLGALVLHWLSYVAR
jgi:hypothetical protein